MLEDMLVEAEDITYQLSDMSMRLADFSDMLEDFICDIDDELYDIEANNWYNRRVGTSKSWNNTMYAPLASARPFGGPIHQGQLYASNEQQRGYGYAYPNEYASRGLGWQPYVHNPYARYIPQGNYRKNPNQKI